MALKLNGKFYLKLFNLHFVTWKKITYVLREGFESLKPCLRTALPHEIIEIIGRHSRSSISANVRVERLSTLASLTDHNVGHFRNVNVNVNVNGSRIYNGTITKPLECDVAVQ